MTRKSKLLTFGGVVIMAALIVVALLVWKPAIAPISPPAASSFDAQTRLAGARVVALGDCIVCHTAKGGKPFAGGLPLATPFGTIYATNLTPDVETGIGSWSLEAFTRAVRHGVSRDGHLLYPAFPYIHFTHMSDGDISAAYAYLMTREPVNVMAPANDLIFPLNFRPLLAFWNVLFLHPGEWAADASKDAGWNRGKLLVDGLGHCASCYSPLNAIGGEKLGHAFDGGIVDGWEAPPLNALSAAPKPWTQEQLVTYLRSGRASEHGAAAGPMLPVTRDLATALKTMCRRLPPTSCRFRRRDRPSGCRCRGRGSRRCVACGATRRDPVRRIVRAVPRPRRADALDRRAPHARVQHRRQRNNTTQRRSDDSQRQWLARRGQDELHAVLQRNL